IDTADPGLTAGQEPAGAGSEQAVPARSMRVLRGR
ncbi:MAG: hypothetical protein QOF99_4387, partial [Pseudonocardiales bacterium]|nr:hypothetical protein [Pseudonocardiales bacterium]